MSEALLALLPAAIGGFWAVRHLSRLHLELPSALQGVPIYRADGVSWRGPGLVILAGSILRLLVASGSLSVACAIAGPLMAGTVDASLLAGFDCLALATVLVCFLVSLRRLSWALLVVTISAGVAVTIELTHTRAEPGAGLIVSSAIAVLLMLPPIVKILMRPGRALATAVWIP